MRDSDFSLIQAVLAGNAEAFGALVTRYQKGVYALVWSMVRDSAAAEDIGQEAFLTAFTRLSELRDPKAFSAWLRRIAVNTARMWLRNRPPRESPNALDQVAAPGNTGESSLREEITKILASLPKKKREVAILCYWDGVSRKDAARFLGVPEATLRKRLHDSKRLLQQRIVEAAERGLEEHLLPRGFARRCICACRRALDAMRKEVIPMAAKNKACGCGCGLQRKAKGRRKRSKTAKSAR